ncbi:MAG: hypothetical protein K1060chlam1_00090 [Candidatus Anoxychlamydiales bacterium]|nr:hypothetical protein [Candidatus Anoxychlamydiales bacterium]
MTTPLATSGSYTKYEKKEIDELTKGKRALFKRFGLNPTDKKMRKFALTAFSEEACSGSGSGGGSGTSASGGMGGDLGGGFGGY